MISEKRCSKCKCLKPLSAFYKNRTKRDGFANVCKPCVDRWHRVNRVRSNEHKKRWSRRNRKKVNAWRGTYKPLSGICLFCGHSFKHASYWRTPKYCSPKHYWAAKIKQPPTTGARCSSCKLTKPISAFYSNKGKSRLITSECIACHSAAQRERHARNPNPVRLRVRQWVKDNPAKKRASERRAVARLANHYVRKLLSRGTSVPKSAWPQPLVELQRELVLGKRLLKQLKPKS